MMRCGLPPYADVKPGPLSELFGFGAVMRGKKYRLVVDPEELRAAAMDQMEYVCKAAAAETAREYVREVEDACFGWWRRIRASGRTPSDAIIDGEEGVIVPFPIQDPGGMPMFTRCDVAQFFLQFPIGIPYELRGAAVDAQG